MKKLLYLLPFVLLMVLASVAKAGTPTEPTAKEKRNDAGPFSGVALSLGTGLRGVELVTSVALATPLWKDGELELGLLGGSYGDSTSLALRHTFRWKILRFGVHAGALWGTYVYSRINDPNWGLGAETVVSGYEGVMIGRLGLHAGLDLPAGFGMRVWAGRGMLLSQAQPVELSGSGEEPEAMGRRPLFGGLEFSYEF